MDDTIAALRRHADNANNSDLLYVEPTITLLSAKIPSAAKPRSFNVIKTYQELFLMHRLAKDELRGTWDPSIRLIDQVQRLLLVTGFVEDTRESPPPVRYPLWRRRTTADGQMEESQPSSFSTYYTKPHFRRIVVLDNNIGNPDDRCFRRSEILCSLAIAEAQLSLDRTPEMLDSGYPYVTVLSLAGYKARVLHTCFVTGEPILVHTPYFNMTRPEEIENLLYATFCPAHVVRSTNQTTTRLHFHKLTDDEVFQPGYTIYDSKRGDGESTVGRHGLSDAKKVRLLATVFASVMGIFLFFKGTASRTA